MYSDLIVVVLRLHPGEPLQFWRQDLWQRHHQRQVTLGQFDDLAEQMRASSCASRVFNVTR
jgi:hypothetical protein